MSTNKETIALNFYRTSNWDSNKALLAACADLIALRAQLTEAQAALHRCYTVTGEEAGDIDDFHALVNREQHVVEAVTRLRKELDAHTKATRQRNELLIICKVLVITWGDKFSDSIKQKFYEVEHQILSGVKPT